MIKECSTYASMSICDLYTLFPTSFHLRHVICYLWPSSFYPYRQYLKPLKLNLDLKSPKQRVCLPWLYVVRCPWSGLAHLKMAIGYGSVPADSVPTVQSETVQSQTLQSHNNSVPKDCIFHLKANDLANFFVLSNSI